MILGKDINPQKEIYYLGSIVIEVLKLSEKKDNDFFYLYRQVNEKERVSVNLFALTLDWLFILGLINNKNGLIHRCF
ncbi:hypothetical protein LJC06_03915 [Bacteroidales bacterium OttesenSCG-928-I14]|nr:hypothetical protein [Bacteroidales bacterium OttesenSCG-928-I14]